MRLTRPAVLLSLLLLTAPHGAAQSGAVSSGGAAQPELTRKVQKKDEQAFIESVERGDAAAVRLFLSAGMSADAGQDQMGGEAVLLRAIRGGHEEVVTLLLDAGADVGVKGHPDLVSALSLAVEGGRPRIVRALLDRKADVDCGDEDGHTNLITATKLAAVSALPRAALRFLSDEDGDGDDIERLRRTPRRERLEILRILLDAGAELGHTAHDCGLGALMIAAMFGDAEVVRTLLDHGAEPNEGTKQWNALRFALMTREELLEELAGDGAAREGANAGEAERRNALAFIEATEKGRAESARLLRAAGARELHEWPEEEEGRGNDSTSRSPGGR